ncbi:MAG: putative glycoside hydrolase [Candidatus Margulisiibacteriota bacterium]
MTGQKLKHILQKVKPEHWIPVVSVLIAALLILGTMQWMSPTTGISAVDAKMPTTQDAMSMTATAAPTLPPPPTHIQTPDPVRGIYVTSWVASIPSWRNRLVQSGKKAGLNAVVIDVKDSTGWVSFDTGNPLIKTLGTEQVRIRDLRTWIDDLHRQNIYVIARIVVFQDPVYTKKFPQSAIQTLSGHIWRDRNGLSFVDVSNTEFWNYIVALSKVSIQMGFDELNFDYVRFPTDGNLNDMVLPITNRQEHNASSNLSIKAQALKRFFAYLDQALEPTHIPLSVDLFGMVLTNTDDLGIGQQLEAAAPYFDYICPMIYPSHWPRGFIGISNPAEYPYEIVRHAMRAGLARVPGAQLRPWLQDFHMGATYDAAKMIAQKQALYDLGLYSYLVWDPANKYRTANYEPSATQKTVKPQVPTAIPETPTDAVEFSATLH